MRPVQVGHGSGKAGRLPEVDRLGSCRSSSGIWASGQQDVIIVGWYGAGRTGDLRAGFVFQLRDIR